MGAGDAAVAVQALSGELAAICIEVAKLALKPPPPPLPRPGFALPAWSGSLVSWAMFIVALVVGYWKPNESSAKAPLDPKAVAVQAIENALKPAPPEEKPTAEDFFYDNPSKPRARWNIAKPAVAQAAPITKVKPASSDDVAQALIDGQRLLLPYQHNSVDALIAVPVGEKEGSGFMLYDGRNRRVIERQVLMPAKLPPAKSWLEIETLKVFYAGQPPAPPPPPAKPVVDPQKPTDTSDLPEREIRRGAYQNTPSGADEKTTKAQPLSEALDTMSP
jgi:hypothetical protein